MFGFGKVKEAVIAAMKDAEETSKKARETMDDVKKSIDDVEKRSEQLIFIEKIKAAALGIIAVATTVTAIAVCVKD